MSVALSRQLFLHLPAFSIVRRGAPSAPQGFTMDDHAALFRPLLASLPDADRTEILEVLERAQGEQLHQKRHPPRRRRRDASGVLVPPPEFLA
jgi:hypothetical protein